MVHSSVHHEGGLTGQFPGLQKGSLDKRGACLYPGPYCNGRSEVLLWMKFFEQYPCPAAGSGCGGNACVRSASADDGSLVQCVGGGRPTRCLTGGLASIFPDVC